MRITIKMAAKCWPIALTYNIDRRKKSIIRVRGALFHEFKGTLAHGEMRTNLLGPYVLQFKGIDCPLHFFPFAFFLPYFFTFNLLQYSLNNKSKQQLCILSSLDFLQHSSSVQTCSFAKTVRLFYVRLLE